MQILINSKILGYACKTAYPLSKNPPTPIMEDFLFDVRNGKLSLTASNLQTCLTVALEIDGDFKNENAEGKIVIPAKKIHELLPTLIDQPLKISWDEETFAVTLTAQAGNYNLYGGNPEDFYIPPNPDPESEEFIKFDWKCEELHKGLLRTAFAMSDDELKPAMNGVFVSLQSEKITFVSTNGHILAKHQLDFDDNPRAEFILPRDTVKLLLQVLPQDDSPLVVTYAKNQIRFDFGKYTLFSQLIHEEEFPNYEAVIPQLNDKKFTVSRSTFLEALSRVKLFGQQTGKNLIRLTLEGSISHISADDPNFNLSAMETIYGDFSEEEEVEIGFDSNSLSLCLKNMPSEKILLEVSQPETAGILKIPKNERVENEQYLLLIMASRLY